MAFLRIENKPQGQYLRIIEAKREGAKIKHHIICSLGKVEDYTPEMLKNIALKLYQLGGGDVRDLLRLNTSEEGRYNYGFYVVFKRLFDWFELDKVLARTMKREKLSFNLYHSVLLMLIERLNDPCSKLASYDHQQEYVGLEPISLQHLYRALDRLYEDKDHIQGQIYNKSRSLFNQPLDVVFYDVTTLYFESEVEKEGSIRQKGFSKDGKIGTTQVLFTLLIDKQKQPIAYQVYKGDTFEGHTFKDAIEKLKTQYQIGKIITVADRGMLSKDNLTAITSQTGYEYILGERLRTLPEKLKEKLTDLKNYEQEWIANEEKNMVIRYTTTTYEGRIIIGTWSAERAKKDKQEREERLQRGQYLVEHPELIKKKASLYFVKEQEKGQYTLDEERAHHQARYDGFLAIATNAKDIDTATVLDHYKHLFQIEHCFRTFKTFLQTRPMFHWTDKRIEGHLCLCFIAYTLLNHLQLRLKLNKTPLSENQIRKALNDMQVSKLKQADSLFYLRAKLTEHQNYIYNILKIKQLPDLMPVESLHKYL